MQHFHDTYTICTFIGKGGSDELHFKELTSLRSKFEFCLYVEKGKTVHRDAFCQFPFRWIYYCHSSKSTGKETGKMRLCAMLGFVNKLFISVQLIVFLDHEIVKFLLNRRKNSNYFKIVVWWSDFMKRNFRGFAFTIRLNDILLPCWKC